MNKERFSFYKEHPKNCSPDDFWGQVKRTVNGTPVSQEQIDMIVNAVTNGLELKSNDVLLDLCCGNGALSTLLINSCSGGVGVDFSEYLISIANTYFANPDSQIYLFQDALDFCKSPTTPYKFTKMVCYGSFPYVDFDAAEQILSLLNTKFPNLERIFIGNCPDKDLVDTFYGERAYEAAVISDPDSPIGIWRTQEEFILLAEHTGWHATIRRMPTQYYAAHYRYDVILTK